MYVENKTKKNKVNTFDFKAAKDIYSFFLNYTWWRYLRSC